jgi:hypothetical protein
MEYGQDPPLIVAVRLRPPADPDRRCALALGDERVAVSKDPALLTPENATSPEAVCRTHTYQLSCVMDDSASAQRVFDEHLAPLVDRTTAGLASTAFIVGHTDSGRAHTIREAVRGCVRELLRLDARACVSVSHVLVYEDTQIDLLANTKKGPSRNQSGRPSSGNNASLNRSRGANSSNVSALSAPGSPMPFEYKSTEFGVPLRDVEEPVSWDLSNPASRHFEAMLTAA